MEKSKGGSIPSAPITQTFQPNDAQEFIKENRARVKRVFIDPTTVLMMIRDLATSDSAVAPTHLDYPVLTELVPNDAIVLNCYYEFERLSFCFDVWHPTFDIVPPGQIIPAIEAPLWQVDQVRE